jgi:hypothetical protein
MSPRYDAVPVEPQLSRPRASTVAAGAAANPEPAERSALAPTRAKPEGEDLVTITVAIPRDIRKSLKVACALGGVTMQQATADAYRMWLAVHSQD